MRVRRSVFSFVTSIGLMVVTTAVALKSTPWLEYWLGESSFGGYRVLIEGSGWLTLLELGLGGALGPLLARSLSAGDELSLRRTFLAGVRSYFWISLATVAVGLLLTPFIHLMARGLDAAGVSDLRRAWAVILLSFLSLVLNPARSLVEARQSGYIINVLLTVQSLVITGLSLLLAWADWGMTGQAAAQCVGVWSFGIAVLFLATRSHPGLTRATLTESSDPETLQALRKLSAPTLLLNLSGRVSVLSDSLIVGAILGTGRVTSLFITQRLVTLGQTILQAVGNASWAALAQLHAQNDRETFNRRLVEMSRMVAVLASIGLVPVVAFNRTFVRLWMGADFPYGGNLVVAIASVNALLLAEQSLWAWCFAATGKVRELVVPSAVAATINVVGSVVLTWQLGIAGPLLGSTLAFVSVGLWVLPLKLRRTFGTSTRQLLWAVALPSMLGIGGVASLEWLTRDFTPVGWPGLIALMSMAGIGILLASLVFVLTSEERALWRFRLTSVLSRPATVVVSGATGERAGH